MRTIDADALLELYADRLQKLEERYGVHSGECGVLAGAMKLLEIQPIIESERKKGKWIYYPKASGSVTSTAVHLYPVCSECGCEHPATNYCPNCGADMRKEGEQR